MIVSVHQPNYMPWLGYFDKIQASDVFVLLDDVQFQKNEFQNRNRIRNAQGAQWLSVPILHNFGQNLNAVKIDNKKLWRKDHLNALMLNYKKAPFFNDYFGDIEKIYTKEWELLSDLNVEIIQVLVKMLGIKTKLVTSSSYGMKHTDSTQRLVDLCKTFKGTSYISGVDGPSYMDMNKFKDNNITIIVQDYQHPEYEQVWMKQKKGGFISHLSVIDLLFNCGEKSLEILSQIKVNKP